MNVCGGGKLSRNRTGQEYSSILAGSYTSPPTRPSCEIGLEWCFKRTGSFTGEGQVKDATVRKVYCTRTEGGLVDCSAQRGARFQDWGRS